MSKTIPEFRIKKAPFIHPLKTWPKFFREVASGTKNFEIRKNDRGFKVGDYLNLREYNPDSQRYTGHQLICEVRYILRNGFGVKKGYIAMAITNRSTSPVRFTRASWKEANR